jgi:predicted Zn-dependent protease
MQPNPVWDETHLLLDSARRTVAILEEAARAGCDCYFSRRKQRWVLYRSSRWQPDHRSIASGAQVRRMGNRDADYAAISNSTGYIRHP